MQSLTQQGFEIKRSTHDDLDLGQDGLETNLSPNGDESHP